MPRTVRLLWIALARRLPERLHGLAGRVRAALATGAADGRKRAAGAAGCRIVCGWRTQRLPPHRHRHRGAAGTAGADRSGHTFVGPAGLPVQGRRHWPCPDARAARRGHARRACARADRRSLHRGRRRPVAGAVAAAGCGAAPVQSLSRRPRQPLQPTARIRLWPRAHAPSHAQQADGGRWCAGAGGRTQHRRRLLPAPVARQLRRHRRAGGRRVGAADVERLRPVLEQRLQPRAVQRVGRGAVRAAAAPCLGRCARPPVCHARVCRCGTHAPRTQCAGLRVGPGAAGHEAGLGLCGQRLAHEDRKRPGGRRHRHAGHQRCAGAIAGGAGHPAGATRVDDRDART